MWFRKKKPEIRLLRVGEVAPNFHLSSVQGGLFRLDVRMAHGPVVLAFVNAGGEGHGLLTKLKERAEEFRRAGAYNYSHPNPEIKTAGRPHSRAGTTIAAIVRATAMEPVRDMQEALELPFYVLWDEASRVSAEYGVREGEIAAAAVETDGSLAWFSERGEQPRAEQVLRAIHPAQGAKRSPDPPPASSASA